MSDRDRAIWRAALTLANNINVQENDRINADDGSLEACHALSECCTRIRGYLEPPDEQLAAMFAEAGVPDNDRLRAELAALRAENEELRKDVELMNWADAVGHYDARCDSLRDELRRAKAEKGE